jgi:Fe-S-cluster containining protein
MTIDRREVGSRAELEAVLREQLGRADLDRVELGEGPDKLILADGAPPTRKCGACTFCCTAAGINDLQKPPAVRCSHLVRGGRCGIYAERPGACREFTCAWLMGNFADRLRPDKVGAYVAFFITEEFGFYAVVQCTTRLLDRQRLRLILARLKMVPEVRIVYDDKRGVILRWGHPPARFEVMGRAPGDYEVLVYRLLDPY